MLENPEERQGKCWVMPECFQWASRTREGRKWRRECWKRSPLDHCSVSRHCQRCWHHHTDPHKVRIQPQVYDCTIPNCEKLQGLVSQVRFTHPHSPWSHALVSLWHKNYAIAICVCTSMSWSPRKLGTLFEITNVAPPPGRLQSSKFRNHSHRLGSCNYRRGPDFLPM